MTEQPDILIDDRETFPTAVLVVTYTDHVEREEPVPGMLAELFKAEMDANPLPGYVSSTIEYLEEESE
jgi:hypothetical protein